MAETTAPTGTHQQIGDATNKKVGDDVEVRSLQHGENDMLRGEIVDQVLAAKTSLINDVSEGRKKK